MTNKEATKYLIAPTATSTKPSVGYLKQKEAYDRAIKALEERPQGEWILCEDNYFSRCSICGDIWLNEECNNYCPKCGAYMRSENNGKK